MPAELVALSEQGTEQSNCVGSKSLGMTIPGTQACRVNRSDSAQHLVASVRQCPMRRFQVFTFDQYVIGVEGREGEDRDFVLCQRFDE